jgi:hypothetical protein
MLLEPCASRLAFSVGAALWCSAAVGARRGALLERVVPILSEIEKVDGSELLRWMSGLERWVIPIDDGSGGRDENEYPNDATEELGVSIVEDVVGAFGSCDELYVRHLIRRYFDHLAFLSWSALEGRSVEDERVILRETERCLGLLSSGAACARSVVLTNFLACCEATSSLLPSDCSDIRHVTMGVAGPP